MLVGTILYGVLGYTALIDDADPLDALYWTFLTIGGVGFQDTRPSGHLAEVFSISLIILLVTGVASTAAVATDMLASGEVGRLHRDRQNDRMIAELSGHYVICGYGRVGRAVAEELAREGTRYVVCEIDDRHAAELEAEGIPFILDDPSHDRALIRAGIDRAKGLVCAVDSDAINVFIALTARGLHPDITIVARAADPESVAKLIRAGANSVVSPYELSGREMARRAIT